MCVCVCALLCVCLHVCVYNLFVSFCVLTCMYFQPGVVTKDGRTPLKLAVQNGKLEVVNYLITGQNIEPTGKYQ